MLYVGMLTVASLVEQNTIFNTISKIEFTTSIICDTTFADTLFELESLDQIPGYALLDFGDIFEKNQDRSPMEKATVLRHNNAISELLNCKNRTSQSSDITNEILDNSKVRSDEVDLL